LESTGGWQSFHEKVRIIEATGDMGEGFMGKGNLIFERGSGGNGS